MAVDRKQKEDYTNPPRSLDYNEVVEYTRQLAQQIKEYGATQVIGVARSGLPFASWVAQMLNIELGYYHPKHNLLTIVPGHGDRIVFVDETSERGETQNKIRALMADRDNDYRIASVFIDQFHPALENKQDDIMYAKVLDFWCDGIAGVCKNIGVDEPQWRDL